LHYSNKTYKNINILSSTIQVYITTFSDRLKTDKFRRPQYNAHIYIDLQVKERKITFYKNEFFIVIEQR